MADTGGCCVGPNGKHLNGCLGGGGSSSEVRRRGRQAAQYQQAKDDDQAKFDAAADKFIATHPHGAAAYTGTPFPGVTCEIRPNRQGRYLYIRRPGGQH